MYCRKQGGISRCLSVRPSIRPSNRTSPLDFLSPNLPLSNSKSAHSGPKSAILDPESTLSCFKSAISSLKFALSSLKSDLSSFNVTFPASTSPSNCLLRPRISPSSFLLSFSSYLPSLLPFLPSFYSFLLSFLPAFPFFIPSFFPFLPPFFPFLPSFLLPSFLPFLPSKNFFCLLKMIGSGVGGIALVIDGFSKKGNGLMDGRTDPLIEMRGRI